MTSVRVLVSVSDEAKRRRAITVLERLRPDVHTTVLEPGQNLPAALAQHDCIIGDAATLADIEYGTATTSRPADWSAAVPRVLLQFDDTEGRGSNQPTIGRDGRWVSSLDSQQLWQTVQAALRRDPDRPGTRTTTDTKDPAPDPQLLDELNRESMRAFANLTVLEQRGVKVRSGLAKIRALLQASPPSDLSRRLAAVFDACELDESADTEALLAQSSQALRVIRSDLRKLREAAPQHSASDKTLVSGPANTHHRARILVVDDERLICSAYQRMLAPYHEVVAVDAGDKARALLEHDSAFDVVICDLMMPEMDGPALYKSVCDSNPRLAQRFVFCSGGTVSDRTRAFADSVGNVFVEKPLSREDLLDVVDRQVETHRQLSP